MLLSIIYISSLGQIINLLRDFKDLKVLDKKTEVNV